MHGQQHIKILVTNSVMTKKATSRVALASDNVIPLRVNFLNQYRRKGILHHVIHKLMEVKFDVLLTVHLSVTLVNDQLEVQFFYFIIRLLESSTRFEQRRAHHQEVELYWCSIWNRHSL